MQDALAAAGLPAELMELLAKQQAQTPGSAGAGMPGVELPAGHHDEDSAVMALKQLGHQSLAGALLGADGQAQAGSLAGYAAILTPLLTRVVKEVLGRELPNILNSFTATLRQTLGTNPQAATIAQGLEAYTLELVLHRSTQQLTEMAGLPTHALPSTAPATALGAAAANLAGAGPSSAAGTPGPVPSPTGGAAGPASQGGSGQGTPQDNSLAASLRLLTQPGLLLGQAAGAGSATDYTSMLLGLAAANGMGGAMGDAAAAMGLPSPNLEAQAAAMAAATAAGLDASQLAAAVAAATPVEQQVGQQQ